MTTEARSVMFVVRESLSLATGKIVKRGIYPGNIETDFNTAGEQTARRLSIILSPGNSDEEVVDITDMYDENAEPK